MVATAPLADDEPMAKVIRTLAAIVATAVSLVLVYWAYAFGRCQGWKGTGTCPRDPLWDWEMFRLVFAAGVLPIVALRVRRHRLLRTACEAAGAGVILGAAIVVITGF